MDIKVKRGKYVVAVSGGVDSMVLLNLMHQQLHTEIVVAHFNHGIRLESGEDEEFVRQQATNMSLPFEVGRGYLGVHASEETARNARYKFLYWVAQKHHSDAIITAHHQDDMVETAFINLMRGTGRKGVVAIRANKEVIRPLLGYTKSEIISYARKNNLEWRDDQTNNDDKYLRNAVRKQLSLKLTEEKRQEILKNIEKVAKIDSELDKQIATLSHNIHMKNKINRYNFITLPANLADELVVYWLRQWGILDYDQKTIKRINIALRTFKENSLCPVKEDLKLKISRHTAEFIRTV